MRAVVIASTALFALLITLPHPAAAVQNITLGWDASPDPNISSYNVRYGLASEQYTFKVPAGTNTFADVNGLIEGMTYYFVVTASGSSGIESEPSNEIGYTVPGVAAPGQPWLQAGPDGTAVLQWNASASPNVAGYDVFFLPADGGEPQFIFSGYDTQLILSSSMLANPGSYIVNAYNDWGEVSASTASVAVTATLPAPVLSLKHTPVASLPNVFSVTATGVLPASWALEASADLKTWGTIADGSNAAVDVTVVVSPKSKLFFRLESPLPDAQLQAHRPADAFPNAFAIRAPQGASPAWTIQSSENLQDWTGMISGEGRDIHVAVVPSQTPALYFRLKSR